MLFFSISLLIPCHLYQYSFAATLPVLHQAANLNGTIIQALAPSSLNQTSLNELYYWTIKGGCLLELELESSMYLPRKDVSDVLERIGPTIGKKEASAQVKGTFEVEADKSVAPYNEVVFVIKAVYEQQITWGDVGNVADGISAWLADTTHPGLNKFVSTYFYLENTAGAKIGVGAMKRKWEKFPPSEDMTVVAS